MLLKVFSLKSVNKLNLEEVLKFRRERDNPKKYENNNSKLFPKSEYQSFMYSMEMFRLEVEESITEKTEQWKRDTSINKNWIGSAFKLYFSTRNSKLFPYVNIIKPGLSEKEENSSNAYHTWQNHISAYLIFSHL